MRVAGVRIELEQPRLIGCRGQSRRTKTGPGRFSNGDGGNTGGNIGCVYGNRGDTDGQPDTEGIRRYFEADWRTLMGRGEREMEIEG